jgi:hypothetical protein
MTPCGTYSLQVNFSDGAKIVGLEPQRVGQWLQDPATQAHIIDMQRTYHAVTGAHILEDTVVYIVDYLDHPQDKNNANPTVAYKDDKLILIPQHIQAALFDQDLKLVQRTNEMQARQNSVFIAECEHLAEFGYFNNETGLLPALQIVPCGLQQMARYQRAKTELMVKRPDLIAATHAGQAPEQVRISPLWSMS